MTEPSAPWEVLSNLLNSGSKNELEEFLEANKLSEIIRTISRLSEKDQQKLFATLSPEDAADLLEGFSDSQAADLIENMSSERAASIMEELSSDQLVDVLEEMDDISSESILASMHKKDATEARRLMNYPSDCAGGLMNPEFLVFRAEETIQDVLNNLQKNNEEYATYNVQYFYVVDFVGKLVGVMRMHDILFHARFKMIKDIMISTPLFVTDFTSLSDLKNFFEEHKLFGVPVVDNNQKLIGVVAPHAVEEEYHKQKTKTFLRISGIIGGEEFRTMPLLVRSGRRLSWLSMNIVLNIIAASVIAIYQDTLATVITLAVFLPMVSDMSGCSGNQAVAVSMRELSLGLVKTNEILWVVFKELRVGLINGVVLGILLGTVAFLWQGNPWLGLVVGGALAVNTLVSVTLGGVLPLILKRMKMDPALVSSPLLTTVTDMCGFFFVLSFASAVLTKL